MTGAERLRERGKLYLFALGPLGLRRSELWEITNGELCDMIAGYHYRMYCERQEQAIHTTAILNMWSKRKITVQDFVGIWKNGRVLSKGEFIEEWKKEHQRRKEGEHGII